MKNTKLNFFEWFAANEALEDEEPSTHFIENYCKNAAWGAWSTNSPIHEGGCTSFPGTCNLCTIEELLAEYRAYWFMNNEKEICQKCFERNPSWFVDDDLWNKYHANYDILCTNCFITLSENEEERHLSWKLILEG